jgi:peptidoglycan-N-acetylglucosamine deacetylase
MKLLTLAAMLGLVLPVVPMPASEPAAKTPIHVTIVFDDGPSANTLRLLEILKKEKVPATFDLIGDNALAHPDLAKAILKGGFQIANHSLTHKHPKALNDAALERDISGGHEALLKVTGKAPEWYWMPYLEYDPRMPAITKKTGEKLFEHTRVAPSNDFKATVSAEQIRKNIVLNIQDGEVIMMHEWRNESLDELPAIIADLRAKGCIFMTNDDFAVYCKSIADNAR